MKPRVETNQAKLPPFWDRNVVFFCNLESVFFENEEAAGLLTRQISGAHSYGGRVVSILNLLFQRGPNKILLEAPPEPHLLDYLSGDLQLSLPSYELLDRRGYQDLGSKPEATHIDGIDPLIEDLRNHPASWVDGYVTDSILVETAAKLKKQTISTLEGSKKGNNKYLLHLHQVEKNLPTFQTFIATNPEEIRPCLSKLRRLGYRKAVIKAQIGASGYGMIKLPTQEFQSESVPNYLFFEGPCMVQGWLDQETHGVERIGSPSIQMFLNENTVFLFDWTEQILSDESVHEGNTSPPDYISNHPELENELFRQAAIAGEWLHAQGYRGTASTDFLVIARRKKTEVIICEINARVTGATYPAVLARHFKPAGCWSMRNIQFRKSLDGSQLLSVMDRAAVLYRPDQDKGIIPFNFNVDLDGKVTKGQFLCLAETLEQCGNLLIQAWAELPVEWGYDRD
ncbi:MAG: hypothetical protein ACREQ7_14715 [Candidatus Binatia bacterium]